MTSVHQVAGNYLLLLQDGAEFFPQLCDDIDAAQHSIYLETYIFAADETGRMITAALQRAAARGVVVRVLLDGFGSAELPQHFQQTGCAIDSILRAGSAGVHGQSGLLPQPLPLFSAQSLRGLPESWHLPRCIRSFWVLCQWNPYQSFEQYVQVCPNALIIFGFFRLPLKAARSVVSSLTIS